MTANRTVRLSLIFILFFGIPVLAAFLPVPSLIQKTIAVAVLLLLTFALSKKAGGNLSALGLTADFKNLRFVPLGLVTGILFFCTLILLQKYYNGISITVNKNADVLLIITGLLYALPGVLMEELIFRGYCLQKATDLTGFTRANIIFAFLFIVWHWIAFNAWGNYGLMLSLITTGFGHLLFSVGFSRSKTLYFPIGIHLGNNWASRNGFSTSMGSIVKGEQSHDSIFLMSAPTQEFSSLHTLLSYAITIACFIIFLWAIYRFGNRNDLGSKI